MKAPISKNAIEINILKIKGVTIFNSLKKFNTPPKYAAIANQSGIYLKVLCSKTNKMVASTPK